MTRVEVTAKYRAALQRAERDGCRQKVVEYLAHTDLFFLLTRVLHREDADNDWVFQQCRMYQAAPDGYFDLWWREGYKSTIITFAGIIFGLMNDPERTYGIFSVTRPIAKSFLKQIKIELETNQVLKEIASDVFWQDPKRQAPRWSADDGLVIKRKSNPKEGSIEAWGLIDGQPAGPHFTDLHYEDIVNKETVRTQGMLEKATEAFLLSLNLGVRGGRRRGAGTRWHYADTHSVIIKRNIMIPRIWTATKDGTFTGEPWLLTREQLQKKIEDMGPYIAACQLFLDPKQESLEGFKEEWLRYWKADRYTGLNLYILCDPANEKKVGSDYTVFVLVGVGSDRNYYVINWIRDRLSLTERANVLFKWHQQYRPVGVGYEQYGMQSDIAHFTDRMERDNYRFGITALAGRLGKFDRIARLIPLFFQGRVYIPETCPYVQYDGAQVDLTRIFVNDEYMAHPFEEHDDMLDALARILDEDMGTAFPQGEEIDPMKLRAKPEDDYDPLRWGDGYDSLRRGMED
jgi:predicted phage terminase large subunit-like protein